MKRGLAIALLIAGCTSAAPKPTLEDMSFTGFVDVNGNGQSADDAPSTVKLSDFLAAGRPGTKILMLNAAAGWCDPCMRESGALPAFAATYQPLGVAIVTVVFQDQNGDPCSTDFAHIWAQTFNLSTPVLVDPAFQTSLYFDAGTMPANMFVDAETGEILTTATGADTGTNPLKRYSDFLDGYLAQH